MDIIDNLKLNIKFFIKAYFFKKFKTTMYFKDAMKYSNYHLKSQKNFVLTSNVKHANVAREYINNGACFYEDEVTAKIGQLILKNIKNNKSLIWSINRNSNKINLNSDVFKSFPELKELCQKVIEPIANNIYKSNYKIFFGVMFKSKRYNDEEIGSALWHSDGAPGTCINVMFYPDGVTKKQGAMKYISWEHSRKLILECDKFIKKKYKSSISKFDKKHVRESKANFYEEKIFMDKNIIVDQPTSRQGSILFFQNNCLHKGGHPEKNEERISIIFNIYPHESKPNYEKWFKKGKLKSINYPSVPNF
jgi:hypothetical protein